MTTATLLRGVDLAAFAVAMVVRLRGGGVTVAAGGAGLLVAALHRLPVGSRTELYWAARLTLVDRVENLPAFDAVFDAVFADAVMGLDPAGRANHSSPHRRPGRMPGEEPARVEAGGPEESPELPWVTLPSVLSVDDDADGATARIPQPCPSSLTARSNEPFDALDPEQVRALAAGWDQAVAHWPQRTGRRRNRHRRGSRLDLRATMQRARRTGWETTVLVRSRPRRRPRRVVLVCDISRSMRPYATAHLHLMRAILVRRTVYRPEVFVFSTELTRLTAALAHRSPEEAIARVEAAVPDRYGGTRIGHSLARLLSIPAGNALRGAIVIIASDGWDSGDPEVLARAMTRIRRRARQVVWLNPRAAQPDFRPATEAMTAALPFCDLITSAHTPATLHTLLAAIATGARATR